MREDIVHLILKQLVGTLTDEEQLTLDTWRQESAYNEETYQRLTDKQRLDVELKRARLTDAERPLSEMKHRLGINGSRPIQVWRWMATAAVVLLLAGAWYLYAPVLKTSFQTEPVVAQADSPTILPGRTQAVLTLDNGEQVELGNDPVKNSEAIAKATEGEPASFKNLSTPRGGEFKVTLEDGTEVWLNAETTLRYPEQFAQAERRVEVEGEAYFKVAKDADRPFYVVSGGQEIRVCGTEFNVNGYADEADILTTLVEGSISLRPVNANGSELMLTPGSQAVFSRSDESARVHHVDTEVVTSWRKGMFVFEDQTMEQIMRTLSRWYNFDYEFSDPQLAETVLMGSIPRYSSFDEVADIFRKLGGIRLTQHDGKVNISVQK